MSQIASSVSTRRALLPGRFLFGLFAVLIGACLCLFSLNALQLGRSEGTVQKGETANSFAFSVSTPTPFQPRPFSPGFVISLQFITPSPTPVVPTSTASPFPPTSTPEVLAEVSTPTPFVPVTPTPGLIWISIVPDTPTPAFAAPAAVAAGEGERWIDVDLSEQRLYAYEGDTLVNSFVVSTGTWRYPTVKGSFKIYVKLRYANMSGPDYYLPNVPYVMYFYKGYGLHGTYWHNNFGTPMSHGCVNLRVSDAAWLFNWASVGTVVRVHD